MMEGRRYSDGLHQALEAKEAVPIQSENQTLASITFQNYFRLYEKLAGMTGTAATEAAEFAEIYRLGVTEIPTHRSMVRKDEDDEVYRTAREKNAAIIEEVTAGARQGPADPGRHGLDREVRAAVRACSRPRACRTRCSTPATTSRRPTSSPRPGGWARSPSPPTWRAAAPTSSSAAMPRCASRRSSPAEEREGAKAEAIRAEIEAERQRVLAARRPVHHRHRAPREPPHRQPAARPLRPPGRSRAAPSSS